MYGFITLLHARSMENVILSLCLISHHARTAYEGVEYGSTYIYPRHYMEAKVSRQPLNNWLGDSRRRYRSFVEQKKFHPPPLRGFEVLKLSQYFKQAVPSRTHQV